MHSHGGQPHEVEPARIHALLREVSTPNDAAETKTCRGTAPPLAPAEKCPPEALHATCDAGATAVIEALVIAVLHALEAHVWDVKKRGALFQDRVTEVAERPTGTSRHQGTTPGDHHAPLCRSPRPVSHDPRHAENPRA
jgi:hypothetical protein